LLDPAGEIRDHGRVEADARRELEFAPIEGEWELRVDLAGASGRYEIHLRAEF
jgi:hypothetical protein